MTGPELRGHSAYKSKATLLTRLAAFFVDLSWWTALFYLGVRVFNLSPIPHAGVLAAFAVVIALTWIAQQAFLGGTVGQLIWQSKLLSPDHSPFTWSSGTLKSFFQARLYQIEKMSVSALSTALFFTLIALAGSIWTIRDTLWRHPLLLQAETLTLPVFTPSQPGVNASDWLTLPFFYASGAWPRMYEGRPVLHTIPYAKAPPKQFIASVVARWRLPDIQLTIEGPKTPTLELAEYDPEITRGCLTQAWNSSFRCLRIREAVLIRHVKALRAVRPQAWSLKWFEVANPILPREFWARGFWLTGTNAKRAQERIVLVNPYGKHQALILDRPAGAEGEAAVSLLREIVGSIKLSEDLQAGRALVDSLLTTIDLRQAAAVRDSVELATKLAQIQALLIAKISVDPRNLLGYYHLAGTALMLAKHASELRVHSTGLVSPNMLLMLDEWAAASKPVVHSAYQYANDVDPQHPKTQELKQIWLESQKY
ncbi:MAG: hypothetical protein AB7P04_12105 [Bacteriovoracia bacterium]